MQPNVLRLGLVSMFNDLGSELLVRLIPLYVAGVLGAPMAAVGAIEGVAEMTATLLKPVFGELSDRLRKRKPFLSTGYSLSAIARPFLAIAGSWPEVAFLRFCDRVGKGVRTAPRDALIADSSVVGKSGKGFGINRTLDNLGALMGVLGFGIWAWVHGENQLTPATWKGLTLACSVPGLIAVVLVIAGISEPPVIQAKAAPASYLTRAPRPLDPVFKRYLAVIAVFCLANSSDAFILLQSKNLGFSLPETLGMIALLNGVASMTAIPAAALSDRLGRRALIALGWVIYAISYALIGLPWVGANKWAFAATVGIYGLFFGFTESVERAWIADLSTPETRGRAYGIFGLVTGLAALPASLGFGWLWDRYGSEVPFLASSAIAFLAVALLFALLPIRTRPLEQR